MLSRAARRDHAAHEGRRADLGALGHGREGAGARAGRRPSRWSCVDGVHALGRRPSRGRAGDVFVAGTHKWLGGPRGTGLIWTARLGADRRDDPELRASDEPGPRFTPGGWHSFEHRWALARGLRGQRRATRRSASRRSRTRLKDGLARAAERPPDHAARPRRLRRDRLLRGRRDGRADGRRRACWSAGSAPR